MHKYKQNNPVVNMWEEKGRESTNSNKNDPQGLLQKEQRLLKLIGILIVAIDRQEYERHIKN
jgi:hypothetical protein